MESLAWLENPASVPFISSRKTGLCRIFGCEHSRDSRANSSRFRGFTPAAGFVLVLVPFPPPIAHDDAEHSFRPENRR
jgi:hypothetical protein